MDMNDFLELLGARTDGRSVAIYAHGDTRDELEMNALDVAREFFGAEVQLEIVPNYQANYLSTAEVGHRGSGSITVRMVE